MLDAVGVLKGSIQGCLQQDRQPSQSEERAHWPVVTAAREGNTSTIHLLWINISNKLCDTNLYKQRSHTVPCRCEFLNSSASFFVAHSTTSVTACHRCEIPNASAQWKYLIHFNTLQPLHCNVACRFLWFSKQLVRHTVIKAGTEVIHWTQLDTHKHTHTQLQTSSHINIWNT